MMLDPSFGRGGPLIGLSDYSQQSYPVSMIEILESATYWQIVLPEGDSVGILNDESITPYEVIMKLQVVTQEKNIEIEPYWASSGHEMTFWELEKQLKDKRYEEEDSEYLRIVSSLIYKGYLTATLNDTPLDAYQVFGLHTSLLDSLNLQLV